MQNVTILINVLSKQEEDKITTCCNIHSSYYMLRESVHELWDAILWVSVLFDSCPLFVKIITKQTAVQFSLKIRMTSAFIKAESNLKNTGDIR